MPFQVCMGAQLQCQFGAAPTPLSVTPEKMVLTNNVPAANIMDFVPGKNIIPFGICNSPSNPAAVAAKAVGATVPCTFVPAGPWSPGSKDVLIANFPALNNTSKLGCALGVPMCISITSAGQTNHMIS